MGVVVVHVVGMLALHLLRRGWRASMFLALMAGLAAAIAMAACAAGRRTATVFDRFVRFADPPQLVVTFCPPDLVQIDAESLARCFDYDAAEETNLLRALPAVESVGRARFVGMTAASTSGPRRSWSANTTIVVGGDFRTFEGDRILVRGRWFSAGAADEVVVNERFVEQAAVTIGEELEFTFWSKEEFGRTARDGAPFHGPSVRVRVVGVVRGLLDLSTGRGDAFSSLDESEAVGGPALAAATDDAGRFGGVLVRVRGGDVEAATAAIEEAFAGRQFNISPALADDDLEPIREAIEYEARSAWAFGLIGAVAGLVFVSQAVARQSRREWSQLPALRALGLDGEQVRRAAWLRGATTGVGSAAIAAITAVLSSRFGPIGQGRRAEVDPGLAFDGVVVICGAACVLVVVTVSTVLPVRREVRPRSIEASGRRRRIGRLGVLPVEAVTGVRMTNAGGRDVRVIRVGTALAGVACAVASVIAAAGLTASLDALTGTPELYGATWDLSIVNASGGTGEISADVAKTLAQQPGVDAAAGIVGTDVSIGDEVVWVQTFRPLDGLAALDPVITAGREPVGIDELAVGSITMRDLGLEIGDTVEVRSTVTGTSPTTMTIVGTTLVNDTYETSPGRGGVVTVEWIAANAPESSADPIVVRLNSAANAEEVAADIERQVPVVAVNPPTPHGAIRNIVRISRLPYLLAGLITFLAGASLAHALTSSIRRSRHDLAVWKTLGFTRRQVRTAVAWHATALSISASAIGIPLGIVVGRVGWAAVADQVGVASPPSTPVLPIIGAVAGSLVAANLIAAYPGWRAAVFPTGRALQRE